MDRVIRSTLRIALQIPALIHLARLSYLTTAGVRRLARFADQTSQVIVHGAPQASTSARVLTVLLRLSTSVNLAYVHQALTDVNPLKKISVYAKLAARYDLRYPNGEYFCLLRETTQSFTLITRTICGSSFPEECLLDPDSLYFCRSEGADPRLIEKCVAGTCNAGEHNCQRQHKCKCKTAGLICGSSFGPNCRLKNDTLYYCNGEGSDPVIYDKLLPNTCFDNMTLPESEPNVDPCACPVDGEICGNFLKNLGCEFVSTYLVYDCVRGKVPVGKRACDGFVPCIQADSSATCTLPNVCTCSPEGSTYCGSQIDPSCGLFPNATYTCTGGVYVQNESCDDRGCVAVQGRCANECTCSTDVDLFCGRTMPGCGLNPDGIYHCHEGWPPAKLEDCDPGQCQEQGESPISLFKAMAPIILNATCVNDPCTCNHGDQLHCGWEFPPECHYPDDKPYFCESKDNPPRELGDCSPMQCLKNDSMAICEDDPCLCQANQTTVCASDFPRRCAMDPNLVYVCVETGKAPKPVEDCGTEKCINIKPPAKCDENPCLCKDGQDVVCGSVFGDTCGFADNSLYKCSGDRTIPELITDCEPQGTCGIENGQSKCLDEECQCTGEMGLVCGGSFLDGCGFIIQAVYQCSGNGTDPQLKEDCGDGECRGGPQDAYCMPNECLCSPTMQNLTVCGSSFPETCGLVESAVYKCNNAGDEPALVTDCEPNFCEQGACRPNECLCKQKETLCGSNFPPTCRLDPNAIYACTGKDAQPIKNVQCNEGECIDVDDSAHCGNPNCECTATMDTVCGWMFPPECALVEESVFQCSGATTTPSERENCNATECIFDGAQASCKIDDCLCQSNSGIFCASDFPTRCGYASNVILQCNEKGKEPVVTKTCPTTQCVKNGTNLPICEPDPCACSAGQTSACSSAWPDTCGYEPNKVYVCALVGERPREVEDCLDQRCIFDGEDAKCTIDDCAYRDGLTTACGNNFPAKCALNPTGLYFCNQTGQKPQLTDDCAPWKCLFDGAVAKCEDSPCLCNATTTLACGSDFLAICNLTQQAVYSCTGEQEEPVLVEICDPEVCEHNVTGEARCHVNECMCPSALATVCGSAFPAECNYIDNAVYNCPGAKQPPREITNCGELACIVDINGGSKCEDDPCKCEIADSMICGEFFPAECGYSSENLYYCRDIGSTPEVSAVCDRGGCDPATSSCIIDPCFCRGHGEEYYMMMEDPVVCTPTRVITVHQRVAVPYLGNSANMGATWYQVNVILNPKIRVLAKTLRSTAVWISPHNVDSEVDQSTSVKAKIPHQY
ncbi:hypothetical protein BGW41_007274 [Actinomortierella wolfii]|nr:hypothetical protein BGW41_007274 [Actinomortierella wolfii]